MTPPIPKAIDQLNAITLLKHAWLLRDGPIAKQLNLESTREAGSPNKQPASNS